MCQGLRITGLTIEQDLAGSPALCLKEPCWQALPSRSIIESMRPVCDFELIRYIRGVPGAESELLSVVA